MLSVYFVVAALILVLVGIERQVNGWHGQTEDNLVTGVGIAVVWPFLLIVAAVAAVASSPYWVGRLLVKVFDVAAAKLSRKK